MNALGTGLVWCGVQVSLLVLAGGVVYAVMRRRGPAVGSLAALALLVIAMGLPVLALSPWPSWWRLSGVSTTDAAADRSAVADDNPVAASGTASKESKPSDRGGGVSHNSAAASQSADDAATFARNLWTAFWDGLGNNARAHSSPAWRWPSMAAWILLAGMALGLARLALGLSAVGRCRKRTRPVTDAALTAILDETRTRLGCSRRIELREADEIGSPATVGWRSPLILLPPEWRDWTDAERRVVLAHEVAHVSRGDFAGWLVAQFSVALHFYNPLVHWLAGRLRIEQELAADAGGALAAGGSGTYLATLAGMALREDDQTKNRAAWAARPFLPARGTLLRRIEMLRDKRQPQQFTFSAPKRIALWSVLAVLGLFIAGLRGPGGPALAIAEAAPPGTADAQSIDLAYVPADAELVVAVRPGDLMKSDAGKLIAKAASSEPVQLEQALGMPLSELDYVKFIATEPLPGSGMPRIVVRALKSHDWNKYAATIVPDPVAVESTIADLAGKKFFKSGKAKELHSYGAGPNHSQTPCYFLPDDRTVIFAPEWDMPLIIAETIKPEPAPKWAKTWERTATGNLAVMLNVEKLRKQIEPDLKQGSGGPAAAIVAMIGPLWQDSERLFVGTDMSDKKLGLLALAECPSEEAASRVEKTSQALLTMALNGLDAARKIEPGGPADAVAIKNILVGAAEELLKQAQVTHEGSTVVLKSEGTGATLLAAASVALPAIQKARDAAGRVQSMNNLKQLALSMFVYMDQHQTFPASAIYSKDGKPLLSWRVSVLPYIEQDALYKQFHLDEPWDSPNNKPLIAQMPVVFKDPSDERREEGTTRYLVPVGKGTIFDGDKGTKIIDITDGTSNTILIVEVAPDKGVTWTKPDDMPFDAEKPLSGVGTIPPAGITATFADGSVRQLRPTIKPDTFRKLILRSDGEPIDQSEF
ncbi:MAG TPA: M56 family metallopeptidase [Pirellulales bacterium]|jgi:beta-lactamase regulating signal transducer with metallopeptidase domain|nr:M56 family metallopeptidase [Pirellulales bacterium]